MVHGPDNSRLLAAGGASLTRRVRGFDYTISDIEVKRRPTVAKKQSTPPISSLASKVLSGAKKPTAADAKKLAASVLSQDEKKGK